MRVFRQLRLANESYVILVICLCDLVATIWLVATRRAIEGNPVMSFYLDRGWNVLIGVKLLLVILPIFVAEWGRRYRPRFVRRMLRLAIAMYLGIYALAFTDMDIMASARRSNIHNSTMSNRAAVTTSAEPSAGQVHCRR